MEATRRAPECDKPRVCAPRAAVVDAAITFGLIKPQEGSTKSLKPLRATDRLHALMMAVGVPASAFRALEIRNGYIHFLFPVRT